MLFVLSMTHHGVKYLFNECHSLHAQWFAGLKDLQGISDPDSRMMQLQFLRALHARANCLLVECGPQLSPIAASLLNHISSRSLEEHIIVAKTDVARVTAF